jgi:sugar (pentulose or hexulose) kinase
MSDLMVLAIDIGSSAVRSAIIDRTGGVVAATRVTRKGTMAGTEFDVARLWLDVVSAIGALPAEPRSAVVALCIAGHVGTVFVDAAGQPVLAGRGWADSSGADLLGEVAGARLPAILAETGRVSPGGGAAAAYLALRGSQPAQAARVARVLTPKDFVIHRLTGVFVTDETSAAYSGLSAIGSRSWSSSVLDMVGLDGAQMPDQLSATAIAGTVTAQVAEQLGLGRDVAVVAGATDGSVGAALVLRERYDVIADIAGTTDVLLRLLARPADAAARSIVNPYPLGGYSSGGPTGATGAALARWATLFGFDDVAAATAAMASLLPVIGRGAGGLMIDPSLSGSRFPHWRADRTGAVLGQREEHGAEHFLLAAAEGAAHMVRDAVDALDPTGEAALVLAGGAARSPVLVQLRADVLGREIEVCEEPDVTILGAALLALYGRGADIGDFHAGESRSSVRPDPAAAEEYAALHTTWQRELGLTLDGDVTTIK